MLQETVENSSTTTFACLASLCLVLLWRFYVFTLQPLIWPSDPKVLPYWVPFLGHTIGFFRSSDKLIERGLHYTGRTHEPFTIQLMGTKFYIITAPADVTAAFRDTSALNFDGHLARLLQNFGVKPEAFQKSWHKPKPGDWCYIPNNPINPGQLDLIHFVEETFKKQLLPGKHMVKMSSMFLDSLRTDLHWDRLGCIWCGELCNEPSCKHVSLYSLCRFFIVEATTRSLFGSHLHDIEPNIVEYMCEFNDHVWMVVFRYPGVFGNPSAKPRKRLMAALTKFIQLPEHKRGEVCWAVKNILAAMEIVEIDMDSRASMMLMSFWAAVSNEYNTAFWILSYLLHDKTLLGRVKNETESAWNSGQLDVQYLCANSSCLEAILNETLRVKNGAGALRIVIQETVIGGKLLQPGNSVMIPFRQLHSNENVWGQTVHEFDPSRFLGKRNLARHPSFRPFGGGATYCPGRVMAKEQVFGFIAIILHRFTIGLADIPGQKQQFPKLNDKTPSLGVSGPLRGMDVIMTMAKTEGQDTKG